MGRCPRRNFELRGERDDGGRGVGTFLGVLVLKGCTHLDLMTECALS